MSGRILVPPLRFFCTLHLVELKLRAGIKLSHSENQFFGGPRMFHHNILRYIKAKEV